MLHFVWIQKICMLSVIQKLIASFTHALLLFHIQGIREESSSLLLLGYCSLCWSGSTTHLYREHKEQKADAVMLAAFKGIHTSVVAAAICFCCPLPLLPPASALCCCCPLPLLATAAAACHCSSQLICRPYKNWARSGQEGMEKYKPILYILLQFEMKILKRNV